MSIKVSDIMIGGRDNAVVEKDALFREVLVEMDSKRLGTVCVVDSGNLVGIITDGDIRRLLLRTQQSLPELFMVNAERIMIKDPKTVDPDMILEDCLKILEDRKIWVVPVVDKGGKLLGLVHMQFLLKSMMRNK